MQLCKLIDENPHVPCSFIHSFIHGSSTKMTSRFIVHTHFLCFLSWVQERSRKLNYKDNIAWCHIEGVRRSSTASIIHCWWGSKHLWGCLDARAHKLFLHTLILSSLLYFTSKTKWQPRNELVNDNTGFLRSFQTHPLNLNPSSS